MPRIEAYRIANRALLLSGNQALIDNYPKLVAGVRAASIAQGVNFLEALNNVTGAITKQESELLDIINVKVRLEDTNKKLAESLGVSQAALTSEQKDAAFTAEILAKLAEQKELVGDLSNEQADAASKLAKAWQELYIVLGNITAGPVTSFFEGVTFAVNVLTKAIQALTGETEKLYEQQIKAALDARQPRGPASLATIGVRGGAVPSGATVSLDGGTIAALGSFINNVNPIRTGPGFRPVSAVGVRGGDSFFEQRAAQG